jgi:hypothetical protein
LGIDVYLSWEGITPEEQEKQLQGFDTTIGQTGYLREAYHGEPYATKTLMPEAFEEDKWVKSKTQKDKFGDYIEGARLASDLLIGRLPNAIAAVILRLKVVYNSDLYQSLDVVKSYIDFVALHQKLESEGKRTYIYASY